MVKDDIIISDGDPGSMTIPLEHDDIRIVKSLPKEIQKEITKNIREYIKQLGKEYKEIINGYAIN